MENLTVTLTKASNWKANWDLTGNLKWEPETETLNVNRKRHQQREPKMGKTAPKTGT